MQTNKNILPNISSDEEKFFKENLDKHLDEMENADFEKINSIKKYSTAKISEKEKVKMKRELAKKHDSRITPLARLKRKLAKVARAKEVIKKQSLLDKSMQAPANMPKFLGKRYVA